MAKWEETLGPIAYFLDGGTEEVDGVPYLRCAAATVQSISFSGGMIRINGTTIDRGSFGAILRPAEIEAIGKVMKKKRILAALKSSRKAAGGGPDLPGRK